MKEEHMNDVSDLKLVFFFLIILPISDFRDTPYSSVRRDLWMKLKFD